MDPMGSEKYPEVHPNICRILLGNEKKPGWLGYIGDYTTQVYRDYNKPL